MNITNNRCNVNLECNTSFTLRSFQSYVIILVINFVSFTLTSICIKTNIIFFARKDFEKNESECVTCKIVGYVKDQRQNMLVRDIFLLKRIPIDS